MDKNKNEVSISFEWNQFQAKMRILRKKQMEILKKFREKLTQNKIDSTRNVLK